jgi:DinB superfamily
MQSISEELKAILQVTDRLRSIDEQAASFRPAPGKWSKKEILGHLIDSATNNHQRFVRLQSTTKVELPGYDQDTWVRLQHYQDRPWDEIVSLWQMYNAHLAEVIRHADPNTTLNTWRTPNGQEMTLEFIMRDYVVHMRHHLEQIL